MSGWKRTISLITPPPSPPQHIWHTFGFVAFVSFWRYSAHSPVGNHVNENRCLFFRSKREGGLRGLTNYNLKEMCVLGTEITATRTDDGRTDDGQSPIILALLTSSTREKNLRPYGPRQPVLKFQSNLSNRFGDNSFCVRTTEGHDHHISTL